MKEDNSFWGVGTDLARQLRQLTPALNENFHWDDVGNAALFMAVFKGVVCYVADKKLWYTYDGTRWAPDVGDVVVDEKLKLLARELQKYALGLDQPLLQQNYGKFVHRWTQRRTRDTILRDARSIRPVKSTDFDRDPWLLNVTNGTVDLRSGKAHSHKPDEMQSRLAPVKFDPNARCERWENFIREVSDDDDDLAKFLQRLAGYALTGSTDEECAFLLLGESTRNGKTTFCTALQAMLGDYAATADPVTLAVKKYQNGSAPSEDLARLEGIRLACLPEPDVEMAFSSSRLKSLTGGDVIVARRPYEQSIEFRPQFKLLFAANALPHCTDPAVFRSNRLWVVPFRRCFPPSEQDHGLKRFFTKPENQSGILNWAVEGVMLYQAEGLNPPEAVHIATESYAEQEASRPRPEMPSGYDAYDVLSFIESELEQDPTGEVRSSDAFDVYRQRCSDNDSPALSQTRFGLNLRQYVNVERRRPRTGGEKASLITGYRLKN